MAYGSLCGSESAGGRYLRKVIFFNKLPRNEGSEGRQDVSHDWFTRWSQCNSKHITMLYLLTFSEQLINSVFLLDFFNNFCVYFYCGFFIFHVFYEHSTLTKETNFDALSILKNDYEW